MFFSLEALKFWFVIKYYFINDLFWHARDITTYDGVQVHVWWINDTVGAINSCTALHNSHLGMAALFLKDLANVTQMFCDIMVIFCWSFLSRGVKSGVADVGIHTAFIF